MHEPLKRRLKDFRLKRGWTQVRLAHYLGLSRGTVRRIEAGAKVLELTEAKINRLLSEAEAA